MSASQAERPAFYCDMHEAHWWMGAPICDEQCEACASPPHWATYHDGRPAENRRPEPSPRGSQPRVQQLMRFRQAFGNRAVASIHPAEAEDWAATVPPSIVPRAVALFNYAVGRYERLIGRGDRKASSLDTSR